MAFLILTILFIDVIFFLAWGYDMKQVAIVVFDEVEVLDFAGPFEVFALTEDAHKNKLFRVGVWSTKPGPVKARNGLTLVPDGVYTDAPVPDVLIVPGGYGAEKLTIHDADFLVWLKSMRPRVGLIASVCTGAFLLAQSGLLDGLRATTHHLDLDELEQRWPKVTVLRDRKWVDEGATVTSGGISSGIDMSLHLVERLEGRETALRTAARMEYRWVEEAKA